MTAFDPAHAGRRVREEREKAGLSLSQLAEASGLTKPYLVRLENQGGNPTLEVLGALADALDVTIADLIDSPKLTIDDRAIEIPASLEAFAAEHGLSRADVRMLASIQWRKGQQPRTPERWRFVHDSLHASRSLDPESDGDSND